jgi:F0F1-type ATP synthase assembly protein I
MSLFNPRRDDKDARDLRQIGLYTAVPALMLAAPLIGYFIGQWLDGKLGTEPTLTAVGALAGIAAAGIEIYYLIKKASAMDKENDDETKLGN